MTGLEASKVAVGVLVTLWVGFFCGRAFESDGDIVVLPLIVSFFAVLFAFLA